MTNTGNNPFAEPDFSSLQTPGGSEATDEDYDDDAEDLEGEFDEDELEDPDELDQSEDDEPGGAELSANDPEVASGEEAE